MAHFALCIHKEPYICSQPSQGPCSGALFRCFFFTMGINHRDTTVRLQPTNCSVASDHTGWQGVIQPCGLLFSMRGSGVISSLRSRLCDGQRAGESEGRRSVIFSVCEHYHHHHQESHTRSYKTQEMKPLLWWRPTSTRHKSVEFISNAPWGYFLFLQKIDEWI